jgi:hypothetical protein
VITQRATVLFYTLGLSMRNDVHGVYMSELELLESLDLIDKAALALILDPRDEKPRHELHRLIGDNVDLISQIPASGESEIWQRKLLGIFKEIRAELAAGRDRSENQLRLLVSYLRTLRSFMPRFRAALEAMGAQPHREPAPWEQIRSFRRPI